MLFKLPLMLLSSAPKSNQVYFVCAEIHIMLSGNVKFNRFEHEGRILVHIIRYIYIVHPILLYSRIHHFYYCIYCIM